jgi:lipopolysaccharide/colanic/teichoic acid biosynthesis glycosyltransferase
VTCAPRAYQVHCDYCCRTTVSLVMSTAVSNPMKITARATSTPTPELFRRRYILIKRAVDVSGALLLLICAFPLLVIIALVIKLQDGGPVLYRRRCVGRRGDFNALKFRSMRVDADDILNGDPLLWQEFQKNFKLSDDPRITKVGAILRKFSLDELPQLVNVVRGEMSLVGPRMITAPELEKYGDLRDLLLAVSPGLTGYWQVSGRQDVSYETRIQMDVFYITNWSIMLDIQILLRTPAAVLKARGAR